MVSIKRYPVRRVVNWYYGNFCTRKCFNKEERLRDCWEKLQRFANAGKGLMITHKCFKELIDNDCLLVCKLGSNFRRRTVGWGQFEKWLKEESFDPDKLDYGKTRKKTRF
jgi:hypothetical protein